MPWRPLPRIAFAVCIYPFHATSTADLPLQIGDELYIIEESSPNGAWLRGYLVAPPSLLAGLTTGKGQPLEARVFCGTFPANCVEIREEIDDAAAVTQPASKDEAPVTPQSARISGEWPAPPRSKPSPTKAVKRLSLETDSLSHNSLEYAFPVPPSRKDVVAPDVEASEPGERVKPAAPVPMLKIGDETLASKREPLIDEIASCLREWHSTHVHHLILERQYERLEEMSQIISRLDTARRQLHHRILTDKEMESVRQTAVWDLANGNRILSGEVIVRSVAKRGRMLTADDSAIEISSQQAEMNLQSEQPRSDLQRGSTALHHALIRLRQVANKAAKPLTLSMSLCKRDASGEVSDISEAYSVEVPTEVLLNDEISSNWRTLFTDLNTSDVKSQAGRGFQVILLIRAITNELTRETLQRPQRSPMANENDLSSDARPSNATASGRMYSFRAGRRSVMFGLKGKKDSSAEPGLESRPVTRDSLQRAKTPEFGAGKSPIRKVVKRISGIAALDITDYLQGEAEAERDLTVWSVLPSTTSPPTSGDAYQEPEEGLEQSLAAALLGPYYRLDRDASMARLRIAFDAFVHPSSDQLIQLRPTLLQGISTTRKIGFSDTPQQSRSDIYITLMEPALSTNGFLSHPRMGSVPLPSDIELNNLQVTLEVRNAAGDRIENCIHPYSNSAGHTAWRTVAADRGEKWEQSIRLAIDPEEVPGSHIVMSIADASVNFPFALCWMPLWTMDAFLRDGDHSLALHKYDEETSDMIAGKRAYLGLPWNSSNKDETITGSMATVRVRSYLCSTQYSQDPTLLGVLRWRDQRSKDLLVLLHRFIYVPELEVVKLFGDVLDALFDMLVHYSGDDEMEDAVFEALVTILNIVNDHRFNLQPRVDAYAQDRFNYPFAFPCLTRSFRRLLQDPLSSDNAKKLRQTCKVGRTIFAFIVSARKQQIDKEVGIGLNGHAPTIFKDIDPIFHDMRRLMLSSKPTLVGTKTLMIQNFHKWLSELTGALSSSDILHVATQFIDASSEAQGKLALYRLLLLQRITLARLFKDVNDEQAWNQLTTRWTGPYWKHSSVASQQWREQVRLCCSVVAAQRTVSGFIASDIMPDLTTAFLALQEEAQVPSNQITVLFPDSYPFSKKAASNTGSVDETLVELAAILAEMSINPSNYPALPDNDIAILLSQLLQVSASILRCEAFPKSWLTLYMYHHKATLQTLQTVFGFLARRFLPSAENADAFPTELWSTYFSVLLKLVASEALSLETFQEQKRRAVWKIAGDVRELGAELLLDSWQVIAWDSSMEQKQLYDLDRMGGYQVQYVPSLVCQVTKLCLSVHEGLRRTAILVLKSMILNEWDLSRDLHALETEVVSCLDSMFKTNNINEGMVQKVFVGDLRAQFESSQDHHYPDLMAAVNSMIDVVDELLDLLVAVHSAESSGESIQIVDTIRLMEFLRQRQRESIYIGYVHRLSQIQIDANNPTEAGLALRMHADLYDWDHSRLLPELSEPPMPRQTAFERKELLMFETIAHLEDGAAWHQALAAYQELAQVYAANAFDFNKLARTQRAMASIYEKIHRGEVPTPRYFRVGFRGMGFASSLRGKEFIFEGAPKDRISTFGEKLLHQYPAARLINGSLDEEIEGQYIAVHSVGLQKDFLHAVNRRPKVSQAVRDYFMLSSPNQFTMSSRRQVSAGDVEDQLQTKTLYTTAEPFPNIQRRSEIVDSEQVELTPVQIGLERISRKTLDLASLHVKAQIGDETSMKALTDTLRTLVKQRSSGSVAGYWKLVPHSHNAGQVDGMGFFGAPPQMTQLEEALRVALVDHAWTIGRCLPVFSTSPAHQTVRAELTKDFEITFDQILQVVGEAGDGRPWLWNLSSQDTEPAQQASGHRRNESDTRAGALEHTPRLQEETRSSQGSAPQAPATNGDRTASMLSSQSSGARYGQSNGIGTLPNETSAFVSNATPALDAPQLSAGPATSSSRPSRIESVTRRLSTLGMGRKGSTDKLKQFETVAE